MLLSIGSPRRRDSVRWSLTCLRFGFEGGLHQRKDAEDAEERREILPDSFFASLSALYASALGGPFFDQLHVEIHFQ